MRMAVVPAALFFLLPLALMAQTPKAELFGGYSFTQLEDMNHHGWNVSLAGNINKNLAFVADMSGHYGSNSSTSVLGTTEQKESFHTFLVGPRVSQAAGKWFTPFAHALFGFSRIHQELTRTGNPATATSSSTTANGFGMALGGGLDLLGDKPLSFRIVQVDYFLLRPDSIKGQGVRVSTGLLFRLGRRQN